MAHFSPRGYKNPATVGEINDPAFWQTVGESQDSRFLEAKEAADLVSGEAAAATAKAAEAKAVADFAGQRAAGAVATAIDARDAAQGAVDTADTAKAAVDALEVMGGVQPGSVNDAEMKLHAEQHGGLFNTALKAQTAEKVAEVAIQRTFESFGMVGDGVANDAGALNDAMAWVTSGPGHRLVGTAGKTYSIASAVTIPPGDLYIDFQDSTLAFSDGAGANCSIPAPFLTTTSAAGVTRRSTKFTVANAAGVQRGDFVAVESPVQWTPNVPMVQHYLIQDVNTATGEIWVEGRIAGDLTPAQITADGKTGDITVRFYRLPGEIHLANGRFVSPNRDAALTLVNLFGYQRGRLDNITVDKPSRNGVNFGYCGHITVNNPSMSEFGWVTGDDGYADLPSAPGGLGYGYGFLCSNVATIVFRDADIQAGWHGLDVARGVTNSLIIGGVAHKNAFAFSTHEGAWVFEIRSSRVFGGMAVTSRAAELIVAGCRIEASLDRAIIGQGAHQYLSIRDTTIDLGLSTSPFGWALSGGYPAATRSAEPSYTELVNVTITGMTKNGVFKSQGDMILDRVRLVAGTGGNNQEIKLDTSTPGSKLKVHSLDVESVRGQFILNVGSFGTVEVLDANVGGTATVPSNSALFTLTGTVPVSVTIARAINKTVNYLARVVTTQPAVFDIFDCVHTQGPLVLGNTATRVRNVINNRTNTANLVVGEGVTVSQSVGNVVLDLT